MFSVKCVCCLFEFTACDALHLKTALYARSNSGLDLSGATRPSSSREQGALSRTGATRQFWKRFAAVYTVVRRHKQGHEQHMFWGIMIGAGSCRSKNNESMNIAWERTEEWRMQIGQTLWLLLPVTLQSAEVKSKAQGHAPPDNRWVRVCPCQAPRVPYSLLAS